MKYVVSYALPYVHSVDVGIEAQSPEHAIEKASELFDAGDIWDDTAECPLLRDHFDEAADSGASLEFEIEQTIPDDGVFPEADGSVKQMRRDAKAHATARALAAAYEQGEANGGSIDWTDIDAAHDLALASQI